MAKYTEDNRSEIPDPTPVELPVGYEHPESLEAMIARMIRVEAHKSLGEGVESFEEADDFDVEDDGELVSEYQMNEMQEEYVHERSVGSNDSRKRKGGGTSVGKTQEKPEGSQGDSKKVVEKPSEKAVDAQ